MKKTCIFVLPLCLIALASCESDPSQEYFSSLGDSLVSASNSEHYRAYSDNTQFHAGLSYVQDGETKNGSIDLSPLCFDFRSDKLLDMSVGATKVSLFGYNAKPTQINLGGDFQVGSISSLTIKPRIYVESGTLYTDLSEAATLRLVINELFADHLESSFPVKGKLETNIPTWVSLDVPKFEKDVFLSKITECYDVAKTAFSFSKQDEDSVIGFTSVDENQIRLVLKALGGNSEEADVVTIFDSMKDNFALTSFTFSVTYNNLGPMSFDFKAGMLLNEKASVEFKATDEWSVSGKVYFAYGESSKAYTVEDPDSFTPIELSVDVK